MSSFGPSVPPAPEHLRLVMLGDLVGKPGLRVACEAVPWLRRELHIDLVVANAENAADGSGLHCKEYRRLVESGVDVITLGDHVYRRREIIEVLESQSNILRPANLPPEAPGRTYALLHVRDEIPVLVTCVLGRVFMKPVDCPFRAIDRVLEEVGEQVKVRFVDFHAEATSDMQLMGRYLDGRVSAVLGTHTHVATADEQIFPGGTAFQCDVGMTGPFSSILGRKIDAVMQATLHAVPTPFHVATEDVRLNATWVDVDFRTGKAVAIGRLDVPQASIT